jgi:CRP/FNR family transcriptional regulator
MNTGNIIDSCKNCISGWKKFRLLSKSELQLVNEYRYEATFRAGEIMIKQGSPVSNLLFLSEGLAKIYIEGHNARNLILGIAKPGQIIMSAGALAKARNNFTVASLTQTQTCFINIEVFKKLISSNPAFAEAMIEEVSQQSSRTQDRLVTLAQKKMQSRLAEILIHMSDEVYLSDDFDMHLSRQELGEMTNMAKECTVRIIREFEEQGLISSRGSKIKILDKEKIRSISEIGG